MVPFLRGCKRLAMVLAVVLADLGMVGSGVAAADGDNLPQVRTERVKSEEEFRLERVIEQAYRRCFRSFRVGGAQLDLRIPFGQSGERAGSPGFRQRVFLDGKGEPEAIWEQIDALLQSGRFAAYIGRLNSEGDKTVSFDLMQRSAAVYHDPGLFAAVRDGPYPGTRVRVYVLKQDREIAAADIYDYLYCVGSLGMDCSGFITCIQRSLAGAYGTNLDELIASRLGVAAAQVPRLVGLWFYRPESGYSERVEDRVENLRPGDIFLFRGRSLTFRHSAVIQSIDIRGGVIRYLQCTDWAPRDQRGVHESFIYFDPGHPECRLGDDSLAWTQELAPAFPGEPGLRYWRDDGDRYRSYQAAGGSIIVRLKAVKRCIEAAEPGYFRNRYAPKRSSGS
jgi:hypothetical protein